MGAGLDLTKIQTKAQKKYIDVYVCNMYRNWKPEEKKQKDLITCSERERYKTERNLQIRWMMIGCKDTFSLSVLTFWK